MGISLPDRVEFFVIASQTKETGQNTRVFRKPFDYVPMVIVNPVVGRVRYFQCLGVTDKFVKKIA